RGIRSVPSFSGPVLQRSDAVSRFLEVRRRVQSDGLGRVRAAGASRRLPRNRQVRCRIRRQRIPAWTGLLLAPSQRPANVLGGIRQDADAWHTVFGRNGEAAWRSGAPSGSTARAAPSQSGGRAASAARRTVAGYVAKGGSGNLPEPELLRRTAQIIADGKILGWFQGRAEWGPRALGNRSIVADPRRPEMKDILNRRIKHREIFRPFAPSILAEETGQWFEKSHPSPFMTLAYAVKPGKRGQIPAPTHVDGTGRLQTVTREANPRYYALISAFRDLTVVPVVLNTSFNDNEPIVCRREDAIDCFLRTQMDAVGLGGFLISRSWPLRFPCRLSRF